MSKVDVWVTTASWNPLPVVDASLCPDCWGWGFAIFPWRGKVSAKPSVKCATCLGSGVAVMRVLALPCADHPDYRQEWKP